MASGDIIVQTAPQSGLEYYRLYNRIHFGREWLRLRPGRSFIRSRRPSPFITELSPIRTPRTRRHRFESEPPLVFNISQDSVSPLVGAISVASDAIVRVREQRGK